jgi:hypothetical protein
MSYPNLPSAAASVVSLPPEHNNNLFEPPLELLGDEQEPLVELQQTYLPASDYF